MPTHPPLDLSTAFPPVSFQEWRRRVVEELGGEGAFEDRLVSDSLEGIRVEPLHSRESPGLQPLSVPSTAPGPWGLWLRCQSGAPEDALASLQNGAALEASGAWLALDRAGRQGFDSDFDQASSLVGRGGVALSAAADIEPLVSLALARGMELGLEAGAQALPIAALALASVAAPDRGRLSGCLGADPFATLASGEPLDLPSHLAEMASLALWANRHAPRLRAVMVATWPYHDAGADAVQELAFALATGVAYLRSLVAAGLSLEQASRQILFVFEVGRDVFLQLAKLRAARTLWAMVLAGAGGVKDGPGPDCSMALHARTSWRTKSAYDPWSNLLRETVEGMAGVLGGARGLTLRPFDQTAGGDSELGRRLALTTQLVLREEGQLHRVGDPAAGSWSVEALTWELAKRGWELFQHLEQSGGMAAALAPRGMVETAVSEAAARRRRWLASGGLAVVGVSAWANLQDDAPQRRDGEPSPSLISARRQQLLQIRAQDRGATFDALEAARRQRLRPDPELLESLMQAAKAGATLYQLVESLERPLPGSRSPSLPPWRDAEPFESLRAAVDRHQGIAGRRPVLLLVELAPHAEVAEITIWTRRLLASVGVEGIEAPGPMSPTVAMAAAAERGLDGVVLVAPSPPDPARVAIYADAMRHAGCSLVGCTGRPIPSVAGTVDLWLQDRGDLLETLQVLLRRLGVAA